MRIALGIEYDGTNFQGLQSQPIGRTIQSTLETALSQVADESIHICCAGRTDTGVHAINQVIHFDTQVERKNQAWLSGTNCYLPKDITVKWVQVVDDSFHARFSASYRHYRYIINNSNLTSAILRNYMTPWHYPLDEVKMREAIQYLLGKHDFSSFRSSACQSKTTVRHIDTAILYRHKNIIIIDIVANAFLHHMVRNIVGVLLKIGSGKENQQWISEVMEARNRKAGYITAPPQGLYLMDVGYPKLFHIPTYKEQNITLPDCMSIIDIE